MNAYEAMKNYGRGTIFSKISTLLHITYFYIRLLHVSYTFHSTFFFLIFSSFLRTTRFDRLQIINKGQKWWLTRFELLIFFLIKNKKKKKQKSQYFTNWKKNYIANHLTSFLLIHRIQYFNFDRGLKKKEKEKTERFQRSVPERL